MPNKSKLNRFNKEKQNNHISGCGIPNRVGRIVNGSATEVNEYPWMAGIHVKLAKIEKLNCGGVLISDRHILTAAHCVQP